MFDRRSLKSPRKAEDFSTTNILQERPDSSDFKGVHRGESDMSYKTPILGLREVLSTNQSEGKSMYPVSTNTTTNGIAHDAAKRLKDTLLGSIHPASSSTAPPPSQDPPSISLSHAPTYASLGITTRSGGGITGTSSRHISPKDITGALYSSRTSSPRDRMRYLIKEQKEHNTLRSQVEKEFTISSRSTFYNNKEGIGTKGETFYNNKEGIGTKGETIRGYSPPYKSPIDNIKTHENPGSSLLDRPPYRSPTDSTKTRENFGSSLTEKVPYKSSSDYTKTHDYPGSSLSERVGVESEKSFPNYFKGSMLTGIFDTKYKNIGGSLGKENDKKSEDSYRGWSRRKENEKENNLKGELQSKESENKGEISVSMEHNTDKGRLQLSPNYNDKESSMQFGKDFENKGDMKYTENRIAIDAVKGDYIQLSPVTSFYRGMQHIGKELNNIKNDNIDDGGKELNDMKSDKGLLDDGGKELNDIKNEKGRLDGIPHKNRLSADKDSNINDIKNEKGRLDGIRYHLYSDHNLKNDNKNRSSTSHFSTNNNNNNINNNNNNNNNNDNNNFSTNLQNNNQLENNQHIRKGLSDHRSYIELESSNNKKDDFHNNERRLFDQPKDKILRGLVSPRIGVSKSLSTLNTQPIDYNNSYVGNIPKSSNTVITAQPSEYNGSYMGNIKSSSSTSIIQPNNILNSQQTLPRSTSLSYIQKDNISTTGSNPPRISPLPKSLSRDNLSIITESGQPLSRDISLAGSAPHSTRSGYYTKYNREKSRESLFNGTMLSPLTSGSLLTHNSHTNNLDQFSTISQSPLVDYTIPHTTSLDEKMSSTSLNVTGLRSSGMEALQEPRKASPPCQTNKFTSNPITLKTDDFPDYLKRPPSRPRSPSRVSFAAGTALHERDSPRRMLRLQKERNNRSSSVSLENKITDVIDSKNNIDSTEKILSPFQAASPRRGITSPLHTLSSQQNDNDHQRYRPFNFSAVIRSPSRRQSSLDRNRFIYSPPISHQERRKSRSRERSIDKSRLSPERSGSKKGSRDLSPERIPLGSQRSTGSRDRSRERIRMKSESLQRSSISRQRSPERLENKSLSHSPLRLQSGSVNLSPERLENKSFLQSPGRLLTGSVNVFENKSLSQSPVLLEDRSVSRSPLFADSLGGLRSFMEKEKKDDGLRSVGSVPKSPGRWSRPRSANSNPKSPGRWSRPRSIGSNPKSPGRFSRPVSAASNPKSPGRWSRPRSANSNPKSPGRWSRPKSPSWYTRNRITLGTKSPNRLSTSIHRSENQPQYSTSGSPRPSLVSPTPYDHQTTSLLGETPRNDRGWSIGTPSCSPPRQPLASEEKTKLPLGGEEQIGGSSYSGQRSHTRPRWALSEMEDIRSPDRDSVHRSPGRGDSDNRRGFVEMEAAKYRSTHTSQSQRSPVDTKGSGQDSHDDGRLNANMPPYRDTPGGVRSPRKVDHNRISESTEHLQKKVHTSSPRYGSPFRPEALLDHNPKMSRTTKELELIEHQYHDSYDTWRNPTMDTNSEDRGRPMHTSSERPERLYRSQERRMHSQQRSSSEKPSRPNTHRSPERQELHQSPPLHKEQRYPSSSSQPRDRPRSMDPKPTRYESHNSPPYREKDPRAISRSPTRARKSKSQISQQRISPTRTRPTRSPQRARSTEYPSSNYRSPFQDPKGPPVQRSRSPERPRSTEQRLSPSRLYSEMRKSVQQRNQRLNRLNEDRRAMPAYKYDNDKIRSPSQNQIISSPHENEEETNEQSYYEESLPYTDTTGHADGYHPQTVTPRYISSEHREYDYLDDPDSELPSAIGHSHRESSQPQHTSPSRSQRETPYLSAYHPEHNHPTVKPQSPINRPYRPSYKDDTQSEYDDYHHQQVRRKSRPSGKRSISRERNQIRRPIKNRPSRSPEQGRQRSHPSNYGSNRYTSHLQEPRRGSTKRTDPRQWKETDQFAEESTSTPFSGTEHSVSPERQSKSLFLSHYQDSAPLSTNHFVNKKQDARYRSPTRREVVLENFQDLSRRMDAWQQKKIDRTTELKEELESEELQECSFYPQVIGGPSNPQHVNLDKLVNRLSAPRRIHKKPLDEDEELDDECTFEPDCAPSRSSYERTISRSRPSTIASNSSYYGSRRSGLNNSMYGYTRREPDFPYQPKVNPVKKDMIYCQAYLQEDVFSRLTRTPQDDYVEETDTEYYSVPDHEQHHYEDEEQIPSHWEDFLERQQIYRDEKDYNLRVSEEKQSHRWFQPKICPRSRTIVKNKKVGRMDSVPARPTQEPEYTFKPDIRKRSQHYPSRSDYSRSIGDQMKREEKVRQLQKVHAPPPPVKPKKFKAQKNVTEAMRQRLENLRLERKLQLYEEKLKREGNLLKECTFHPKTREAPAYMKRTADTYRRGADYNNKQYPKYKRSQSYAERRNLDFSIERKKNLRFNKSRGSK